MKKLVIAIKKIFSILKMVTFIFLVLVSLLMLQIINTQEIQEDLEEEKNKEIFEEKVVYVSEEGRIYKLIATQDDVTMEIIVDEETFDKYKIGNSIENIEHLYK